MKNSDATALASSVAFIVLAIYLTVDHLIRDRNTGHDHIVDQADEEAGAS